MYTLTDAMDEMVFKSNIIIYIYIILHYIYIIFNILHYSHIVNTILTSCPTESC